MNKTVKFLLVFLLVLSVCFGVKVFATEMVEENAVNYDDQVMPISVEDEGAYIPEEWRRDVAEVASNIIDGNVFEAKDEYILEDKNVLGDMYVFGDKVVLKNVTVSGNLFMFGDTVNYENVFVTGSAYVFALNFNGNEFETTGNLYFIGENAYFSAEESSFKDLYLYAEKLNFKSNVSRDALIAGNSININAGTNIGRNFVYPSDIEINIDDKVVVGGEKQPYEMKAEEEAVVVEEKSILDTVKGAIQSTLMFSSLLLLFVVLCSRRIVEVSKVENAYKNILPVTGKGTLVIIISFFAIIALMITVIGIPIALLLLLLYIVLLFIATPVTAVSLASMIVNKDMSKVKLFFISLGLLLVINVVLELPLGLLGVILSYIVVSYGVGIVYNSFTQKSNMKKEKNNSSIVMTEDNYKVEKVSKEKVVEDEETTEANIDVLNKIDEIDDEDK